MIGYDKGFDDGICGHRDLDISDLFLWDPLCDVFPRPSLGNDTILYSACLASLS